MNQTQKQTVIKKIAKLKISQIDALFEEYGDLVFEIWNLENLLI